MPPTSRGSCGFTLLESLVVLFILSVTAAVAYPGMQRRRCRTPTAC